VTSTLSRTLFDEKFVDADGFHVRYLEAGSGPPLVYLHGAGGLRISHALGLDRFNLWGTSFGGGVALWAALGSPESIQALVLEGSGAIPPFHHRPKCSRSGGRPSAA